MKQSNLFAAAVILFIAFSGCEKNDSECELVPAKIIRYDCDRVIFQLMTAQTIGDADWEDVETGLHYRNVVSYYNTCRIAALTNGEKTTLYVQVGDDSPGHQNPNCIQCLAISPAPPQKKVDLMDISTSTCEPSGN